MRSMTGFGRGTAVHEEIEISCEVRSVNHRGLDVRLRLPRELNSLEEPLRAVIRGRLSRGRVEAVLHVGAGVHLRPRVRFDEANALRLVKSLRAFAATHGLSPEVRLGDLFARDELFMIDETPVDEARYVAVALEALASALDRLEEAREAEGAGLLEDVRRLVERCRQLGGQIRQRVADAPTRFRQRLEERLATLEVSVDEARLAQEVALLAERVDVSEELARLQMHLDHFEALSTKDDPVGRKLDFLCQELMREANTLGSKCQDAEVAHLVVELKAEIERLREQVQNVE